MLNSTQSSREKLASISKRSLIAALLEAEEGITLHDPIRPRLQRNEYTLSFSQRRLWFLEQMQAGAGVYNVRAALRLHGALIVPHLERSLAKIVQRHEVLRARFIEVDGEPKQVIGSGETFRLPIVDLSSCHPTEREEECRRHVEIESGRGADLRVGPLFRPVLLRLADNDHVLVLAVHHIVCDAWSMGLLLTELSFHYRSSVEQRSSLLPPLTIQYADYADWHNRLLEGPTLLKELAYWKQKLAGCTFLLELVPDYPRPPVQTFSGAQFFYRIPKQIVDRLAELGRSEGATLFMILLAGYKLMLMQRTGQTDVAIGTPVAGRARAETEELVGCFVNTLVLRTVLDSDFTGRAWIRAVRDTCLEAFTNSEVPFEKLVAELRPERDLSRPPLAQAFFVLQNARRAEMRLPGLQLAGVPLASSTSKFELSVDAFESNGGLDLFFDYNPDLFAPRSIESMAFHLEAVLAGFVAEPEAKLSELRLLTEEEEARIVREWNATGVEHAGRGCVQERISGQARQRPERIAIRHEGRELSYGELEEQSTRLANRLRKLGAGRERLVGVCVERSPEMVVAVLAVLKAGAAYVPLDPGFPAERLQYMLADSEAAILITQTSLAAEFSNYSGQKVLLDRDAELIGQESTEAPVSEAGLEQLAYVIYTSGSTGRPKGVMIPHGALVNLLESMRREPGLQAGDVLLAVTTLSFDIAGLELFLPLLVGAQVEMASREVAMDGERLAQLLATSGATVMQATPATWRMLIESGWQGDGRLKVLTGGEALSAELAGQLRTRAESVWNVYGPTETTIWSTVAQVTGEPGPVPIGRPIANTTAYILDRHGRPVPVGVTGQLHIGGQGLARGYWKQEALTAEKFVWRQLRAGGEPERIYQTGDLARYRPDGRIECLGRMDSQVKVRGYRIELGEIESVLRRHDGVRDAVVVAQEDQRGDKRLIAYVVQIPGAEAAGLSQLRAHASHVLPEYMVPSAFVPLERLPMTPNGKVDRKALRLESAFAPSPEAAYAAPETGAEAAIAAIWAELLRVEQVGRSSNFFDLGGHSLLLAKVYSRVRAAFATDLTITEMFKYPTVSALAERVSRPAPAPPAAGSIGQRADLRLQAAARKQSAAVTRISTE